MRHRLQKIVALIVLCLGTHGCFHLQSAANFPTELKTLSLVTDNVYGEISEDLTRKLRAVNVQLTTATAAPVILKLSNSKSTTIIPTAFNSLMATSYAYSLSVRVELSFKMNGKSTPIFNAVRTASQSVTYNVNQIGTPVITPLMRRTLTRQLVNSIYTILTSTGIKNSIATLQKKH